MLSPCPSKLHSTFLVHMSLPMQPKDVAEQENASSHEQPFALGLSKAGSRCARRAGSRQCWDRMTSCRLANACQILTRQRALCTIQI